MTGLLNILKTPGMTSHDVVFRLRRLTKIKRIGHAGTLDPQAAGVLPVCIGNSTKMIPFLDHRVKTYRVEMKLGITTDTQDTTGVVVNQTSMIPSIEIVKDVLKSMIGEYWQTPPMYSAIKINGKKLYELARKGQVIEREPRKKTIYDIRWISGSQDTAFFDVDCSEGTYVRTLCNDVGSLLGCGAAMSFLLRTESCHLRIEDAITLSDLENDEKWSARLLPVDVALEHYPKSVVGKLHSKKVLNGVSVPDFLFFDVESDEISSLHNYPEKKVTRVYLDEVFIGMGEIALSSGELSMVKLLSQSFNSESD